MDFKDFYVGQEYREKQVIKAENVEMFSKITGESTYSSLGTLIGSPLRLEFKGVIRP